ncbi:hypothetical protein ILUMI_02416 [Ignelater luminosus]|uniref:Chitin-binding type-2 domain-containing protein n=1 Tax=Ignelater luminosus TaxID=2038154 RepID=A0A8K0DCS1_IGNLU|nr:hypothetical protein ILUMI_02416 [Ignelater luminosus]
MKRPPGLWLLLSAGVLWLSFQNVYALRATELIFGKTTTTTTTTETAPEGEQKDGVSTENSEESENSIKSNLTGNPQLDYIFDPNLPRELNGYNLSSYPFYNSMPEDIDFKCDGLHDGFYASVPHKCQVYHHCLFGTRYDFLCANYTAFDQKTFICHFVSEVDCNNSRKYWHRNDALYQAATTTTQKPIPVVISPALTASARRPSPAVRRPKPSRRRPQYDYYDEEYDDDDGREDYYEEPPPRRRRKRPRPHRRRPIYEDDYEEYEDGGRYERRGSGRRNGDDDRKSSYDRRESDDRHNGDGDKKEYDSRNDRRDSEERHSGDDDKRSSDRKQSDDRRNRDDDRDYDRREIEDRRNREDDRRPYDRKEPERPHDRKESGDRRNREEERKSHDRKPYDRRESDDDNRKQHDQRNYDDRRYDDRPSEGKRYKEDRRRDHDDRVRYEKDEDDVRYDRDRERRKENDRRRRPDDDYRDDRDDRRPQDKRSGNDRRYEKRRPSDDEGPYERPRKSHRRPYDDDLYDDERDDNRRGHNRPRKNDNKDDIPDNKRSPEGEGTPLVKPNSSSSVFNQPRMPPRIRPPVPKNEQNKFVFKTTTEKPAPKKPDQDEEYYDYEDEPTTKRTTPRPSRKPDPEPSETRRPNKSNSERDEKRENRRPLGSASRPRIQMSRKPVTEPVDDYEEEKPRSRPHNRPRHDLDNRDSRIASNRNRPPAEDDFFESENERSTTPKPSSNSNKERNMPKFVPKEQRGRNEFRDRPKPEAVSSTTTTTTTTTTTPITTTKELPRERHEPVVKVVKRPFLPSRGGNPYSARGLQPVGAKALENSRNSSPAPQEPNISTKPVDYNDDVEFDTSRSEPKPVPKYNSETTKSTNYNEPRQNYKLVSASISSSEEPVNNYKVSTTEDYTTVQNGRRFPTSTEHKPNSFIINEQPVENYKRRPSVPDVSTKEPYETPYRTTEIKEPPPPEEKPFKPSPILIKVPVRLKYSNPISNDDDEEFRPVSNRPQSALRPNKNRNYDDPRTTEKAAIPERNPLDINENEYDVTLNDALNPTIPNLPIRNFPASFSPDNDYTYSSFQRPRYDVSLNQASENRYQVRAPSQRVETVQPYVNEEAKKIHKS